MTRLRGRLAFPQHAGARKRAVIAGIALGALGLAAGVAFLPNGLDASARLSGAGTDGADPFGAASDARLGGRLRAHFSAPAQAAPAGESTAGAGQGPRLDEPAAAPLEVAAAEAPVVASPAPAPLPPPVLLPSPTEVAESAMAPAPPREAEAKPVLVASASIDGEGALLAPRAKETPLPDQRTVRVSPPALEAPTLAPTPATKARLSADEVQDLMSRAGDLLHRADIAGARLLLSHAASGDEPRATFVLAQTYDPNMLAGWKVRGIRADADKARELYGQALAGGVAEAEARLRSLPAKTGR